MAGRPARSGRVPPPTLFVVPRLQTGQQHLLLVIPGTGRVEQVLPERARQLVPEIAPCCPPSRCRLGALVPMLQASQVILF